MRKDEFPIVDKHVQNEINGVLDKIIEDIESLPTQRTAYEFYETNEVNKNSVLAIIKKYKKRVNG